MEQGKHTTLGRTYKKNVLEERGTPLTGVPMRLKSEALVTLPREVTNPASVRQS